MTYDVDIAVIGGGPAGLAAADSAKKAGVKNILILERDFRLGGILNQCIHNGFGLHTFKEELTGPEYADRYIKKIREDGVDYMLDTMVTDLKLNDDGSKTVTAMNRTEGIIKVNAKAVILSMGCRERARGSMNTPGFRGAGIYSAGTAQLFVNINGKMPGRQVVIVGSGDIGLIMARRMTLEGAKVKMVVEIMPHSGGLKRNIVQCLQDFGIPLRLSHTVTDIRGGKRVEGVVVSRVDDDLRPVEGSEEYVECDTVLYSVGLIPENEITLKMGAKLDERTNAPLVGDDLQIDSSGVFACGNVLHVHDIVDHVTEEAVNAGENAASFVLYGKVSKGAKGLVESAEKNVYVPGVDEDKMTCVRCPNGCLLSVEKGTDGTLKVTGNLCPRGEAYAVSEFTAPMRTLTTTVRVKNGTTKALPVKTSADIPKEKLLECIRALTDVEVAAPKRTGDIIVKNIADTGSDIIATGSVDNV
ncbi:MAG: FAD-dependent oxidoreductase [Lachnospiraceae bacterium]|nr:FAD-dependent oxidoreductase [Lachnospiraceae bacterium]